MSMNTVPERLAALRAAMKANGVDGLRWQLKYDPQ